MRLTPLLPAVAAAIALGTTSPADAASPPSAAQVVPGKVIVRYKGDVPRHARAVVQENTGTSFGMRLPGGSRTLDIEDGQSVEQTVAELNGHEGRFDDVIADATVAHGLEPKHPAPLPRRARAYLEKREPRQAIADAIPTRWP